MKETPSARQQKLNRNKELRDKVVARAKELNEISKREFEVARFITELFKTTLVNFLGGNTIENRYDEVFFEYEHRKYKLRVTEIENEIENEAGKNYTIIPSTPDEGEPETD